MPSQVWFDVLNAQAGLRDLLWVDVGLVPDFVLSSVFADLLRAAERISDELDARGLP
jgi:hypothetical protein